MGLGETEFPSLQAPSCGRWLTGLSLSVFQCDVISYQLHCPVFQSHAQCSVNKRPSTLRSIVGILKLQKKKKTVLKQVLLLLLLLNAFQFNQKTKISRHSRSGEELVWLWWMFRKIPVSPSTNWPLNLIHDPEEKPTDALHNTERNTGYLSVHCWVGRMASGIVTLFRSRGFCPGPVWLTTRLANRTS